MELNFSLTLPQELYTELVEACQNSECSPKQFASECLEGALASRRLPKVFIPRLTQGARMCGTSRGVEIEPEDAAEAGLITHRVLIPSDTTEML